MTRQQRDKKLDALPDSLLADCRQIAADLRAGSDQTHDEKIMTARVRICSGYYDSERVLYTIASRMLTGESQSPDSFLAG